MVVAALVVGEEIPIDELVSRAAVLVVQSHRESQKDYFHLHRCYYPRCRYSLIVLRLFVRPLERLDDVVVSPPADLP